MSEMEASRCVCGATADETVLERRDLILDGDQLFRVGRCVDCGVERLNPRPTLSAMGAFYPSEGKAYDPYQHHTGASWLARLKQQDRRYGLRKRLRAIEKHQQGGELLDVGAGSGAFVEEVGRSEGWTAIGVEANDAVATSARRRGLDMRSGTLEAQRFPAARFDVVTMWDVLEHLHDPLATLQEIHRILRPRGLVVASTPNLDSWDRRLFGQYWIGYELPRHTYLVDVAQGERVMRRAGFHPIDVRSFFGSHAYFMTSFRFWAQEHIVNTSTRRLLDKLAFSPVARLLFAPYFWVADHQLKTTTMTLIARKGDGDGSE